MMGIKDVNLFDNSILQAKSYSTEMTEKVDSIEETFALLKDCLESNDLKYLVNDLETEIAQLDNVNLKIEHYYKTMTSVREGYKSQEQAIADSANLYLNSIKEDD